MAQMSEKLTRVTTMLEINFDPETGHVTKKLADLDKKVEEHDKFVTRATWTFRLAALVGASGVIAAIKAKFGIGNN
jgi:hypothetical protein